MNQFYPSPCCGYTIFAEPAGSHDICSICFWEDDIVQLGFPTMRGGANTLSLYESQLHYLASGVSDPRFVNNVRQPTAADGKDREWRPFNPAKDTHLDWSVPADHLRWKAAPNDHRLYWWRDDYWLRRSS
jgi:hypothetical protein